MEQTTKKVQQTSLSISYFFPLILVLAVIPLVVIIHVYDCGLQTELWFSEGGLVYDFFLYYKSRLLIFVGILLAIVMAWEMASGKRGALREKNGFVPLIPAGVFAFFSLISAIFAENHNDAFWGGYEQFEGVFVLLTYVLCFCFACNYIDAEKWVDVLLKALIVGSLIVGVLGFFQSLKLDYMKSDWMHSILTSMEAETRDLMVTLNFEEGMAYSTLYNPNYVGSYVSLALPVMVMAAIWVKGISFKIMAGVSAVTQFVMLYASQSFTGFIGLAGAVVVLLIFLLPLMKRHLVISITAVVVCVGGLAAVLVAKPQIIERLTHSDVQGVYTIRSMTTAEQSFEIQTGSGHTLIGEVEEGESVVLKGLHDKDGNAIACTGDLAAGMTVTQEGYEPFVFTNLNVAIGTEGTSIPSLRVTIDGKVYDLVKQDGKLKYLNLYQRIDDLTEVPAIGFENNYEFATKRGYIWSHTFPLLGKTAILGAGADNFVYAFPNNDYIGKINSGFDGQIMTKPHNMYLQLWVQDGMFACLALIALYIMLFVDTCRSCFAGLGKSYLQKISIGILCGATGYMMVGLANDATITVAPIFWTLLGVGFAANRLVRKQRTQKEVEKSSTL